MSEKQKILAQMDELMDLVDFPEAQKRLSELMIDYNNLDLVDLNSKNEYLKEFNRMFKMSTRGRHD